ncbi:MAG: hypothetical protein HZB46_18370, partial [Solirubrobacterales bacterium]|nr:hypothetical protein [Solirubrobacterales bacterium]
MHLRRRRTIAALLVALVALVITVVALAGNDDEALPEAGSRFGATSTPTTRAISEPGDAGVEKVLGAPVQDAVTRLFLIGFPGYGPDRPTLKRLARRDWGGVVLERGNVI